MQTLNIKGMMCQNCVKRVKSALEAVAGVQSVAVDLAAGTAVVEGAAPRAALVEAVEDLGYDVA